MWFEVPLDYANPHGKVIKLFGRTTTRYERPIVNPAPVDAKSAQKPYLVFLQGGPGFGNPAPDSSPLTRHMLDRGYELLLLDYRGVGYSCPVTPESLSLVGGPQEQADYLKLFRADNIVRDVSRIRCSLLPLSARYLPVVLSLRFVSGLRVPQLAPRIPVLGNY